jgi:uncharacterized protein YegL
MKKDHTKIVAIVDKSGSMCGQEKTVVSGYNEFLSGHRTAEGTADITLVLFNTTNTIVYQDADVTDVQELTEGDYVTGGLTALLDALGGRIDAVGAAIDKLDDDQKPEQVIFFIMTDGAENRSTEYNLEQVREKIKHQDEKYGWTFLFLGAGPEAFDGGLSLGIAPQFVAHTSNDAAGHKAAYGTVADISSGLRSRALSKSAVNVQNAYDSKKSTGSGC